MGGERLQLMAVGRPGAVVLDGGAVGGGQGQPVVCGRVDEIVHEGRTGAADDLQRERIVRCHHRIGGQSGGTVGEFELDIAAGVDTGGAQFGTRPDDGRIAQPQAAQAAHDVQAVTAEVHQRTTGQIQRPARIVVTGCGHRHPDLDPADLAQVTVGRQPERPAGHRVEEVVEPLQHGHTSRRGGGGHPNRLGMIAGKGLFTQHRLARRDGGEIPRCVQCVGQWVVDHVDLRVVDDVLVGVQHALDAVLVGEGLGAAAVPGRHGHQAVAEFDRGTDDRHLRDPGRAEHPDAQWAHPVTLFR